MQAGLLTGKFSKNYLQTLDAEDWRLKNPLFQEPRFSMNVELVESLRGIAERNQRTLAELAIAWVLRRPELTAAIVGARRPSQIEGTAPASDWALSAEDAAEIELLLSAHEAAVAQLA
jgi:aryl-alcohol dehydrogenase-like predicted oxidoreductase